MASAQPANTEINVFRRARSQVQNFRHDSIKQVTGKMRPKIVIAPGEEIRTLHTVDTSFKTDSFRFGHPVVRYSRTLDSAAKVYTNVSGLAFPVRLTGDTRDMFIEKTVANVGDDLHGEVRDSQSGPQTGDGRDNV